MGLDMYLYKKRYTKNWDHTAPKDRWEITIKQGDQPATIINPTFIYEEVGYWRKANHIHKWFVDHVQDGNDDGLYHYVDPEQLEELLKIVQTLLESSKMVPQLFTDDGQWIDPATKLPDGRQLLDVELAQKLLPTQEGFFFGATEYGMWYLHDLRETEQILTKALAEAEGVDFEYHASW